MRDHHYLTNSRHLSAGVFCDSKGVYNNAQHDRNLRFDSVHQAVWKKKLGIVQRSSDYVRLLVSVWQV
jgi:hypothetical protein